LLITFGLGMVSALPAVGIQMLAAKWEMDAAPHIGIFLIYVFIIIAFSEELVKLGMILLYPFKQPFFNEPMDGIVYSMMVSMGFAIVENLIYAFNFGLETVLVRAFTAVPAHAVFAVFMGYFVGLARFNVRQKLRIIITGFFLAVFIHGLYDFFILQQYYDWLMLLGILTVLVGGYLSWQLIRDHRLHSPFRSNKEVEGGS